MKIFGYLAIAMASIVLGQTNDTDEDIPMTLPRAALRAEFSNNVIPFETEPPIVFTPVRDYPSASQHCKVLQETETQRIIDRLRRMRPTEETTLATTLKTTLSTTTRFTTPSTTTPVTTPSTTPSTTTPATTPSTTTPATTSKTTPSTSTSSTNIPSTPATSELTSTTQTPKIDDAAVCRTNEMRKCFGIFKDCGLLNEYATCLDQLEKCVHNAVEQCK